MPRTRAELKAELEAEAARLIEAEWAVVWRAWSQRPGASPGGLWRRRWVAQMNEFSQQDQE